MTAALSPATPAQAWFSSHYAELQSRARACVARLPYGQREEAQAEILGNVFAACASAARRGTLEKVTPFHAVDYAARRHRCGRRLAGSSSTDVMAEATRLKGRCRVVSLSSVIEDPQAHTRLPLSEVLADSRQDNSPLEKVRQNLDYATILQRERVSRRARQVFHRLAADRTTGVGLAIAQELKVSPGRVSQLKTELAQALAAHDYATCD